MMSNVSVEGELRPRGACRIHAAAAPPLRLSRSRRDIDRQFYLYIVLPTRHPPAHATQLLFPANCAGPFTARRLHVSHIDAAPDMTPVRLPPPAMLPARVLRRNFSLFNRVPYGRIARSAARDGHETITIHRVHISKPVMSRS
jgi:hypothetical protein